MDENKFPLRLKLLRQELGLSQKDFAESINISAMAISTYENGAKSPSVDTVFKIADKYKVSIDWLCGLSNNKNLENTFQTYGDIITALFSIDKYTDFILDTDQEKDCIYICFDDKLLKDFLSEWYDATNVLYNTSINRSITKTMYDSWVKSKLEEYSNKKLKKKRIRE